MRVFIHSGHLSLDNGAIAPLTAFFNLAKILEIEHFTGSHYGDDQLSIPETLWPIAEELIVGHGLLYKIEGQHTRWQNVRTDIVRKQLARVEKD